MYTSYIGKKFLKLYNQKESKNYSARTFFDEILFPVFFDDEKHLMQVHGSSFFQKVGKKDLKPGETESIFRLNRLHQDIANGRKSGSTFVGYAAEKITQPTSSQVTSLDCKIDAEEMYASWIGEGLAIGLSGSILLIDTEEVLWKVYSGWSYYREYLNQTPNLKGRQIETWNGHWICHCLSKSYEHDNPLSSFNLSTETNEEGGLRITTQEWTKIIFGLALNFPDERITAYAYQLSKTNTTYGFINIYLKEVRRPFELRNMIFLDKKKTTLSEVEIESLKPFYRFKDACALGTIGIKALEPDQLRNFMPQPLGKGKEYIFSDENSYTQLQIFKIWIIAMLNKTELLNLAGQAAKALLEFETKNSRTKTYDTLTQEVRRSSSLKYFIDKISEILEIAPENAKTFKTIVESVLMMPTDHFPLFITLIRFEYNFQKSTN